MLSVIIPSRNERFLQPTIQSCLDNAEGEVEVIVILDGYWPEPPLKEDKQLKIIHRGESKGMRNAINSGVAIAQGKHILKLDAHCMVDKGYDIKLAADCEGNWIVIPRRKRLDAENWCIQDNGKPDIDYMYLSYPDNPQDFGGKGLNGKNWDEKNLDPSLKDILIDDVLSAQGSGWFMHRDYFYELELMDEENYGSFWNEAQEFGFKCWLSGGRMVVNKKTWYAHLHKGKKYGRGYNLDHDLLNIGSEYTKRWLTERVWRKQTLPFSSMIERFMPMPTWDADKLTQLKETEAKI